MRYHSIDIIFFSPEVEKLYKKAGVEKIRINEKILPPTSEVLSYDLAYPEFTEIKQFRLFKVLINGRWIETAKHFNTGYYMGEIDFKSHVEEKTFDEALAAIANLLWENISDKDKEEIKEILEGR